MRVRRKRGTMEKLAVFDTLYCQAPQEMKGKWRTFLPNAQALHVEIGTGKGRFITTLAQLHPDIMFVAVEYVEEVLLKAVQKAEALGLKNVQFLRIDAAELETIFEDGEIDQIYLNFSDPWTKNKQAKRRLTYRAFLERYKSCLAHHGAIYFKTDNEKLFEFSLNEFCAMDWKLSNITFNLHNSGFEGNIMTEYEEKFSLLGMKIFRVEASKHLDKSS
ncbi:MAG: tRNA (guanosine(46)-N7)-methyltransferase TrmB [Hyphomonadaceae bacterium]|nr:tRNA (guanosine(46)-N7)-methyltransferase TrmB [Clostridia bacterium]